MMYIAIQIQTLEVVSISHKRYGILFFWKWNLLSWHFFCELSDGRVVFLLRIYCSNMMTCFHLLQNFMAEMMVSLVQCRNGWNRRKATFSRHLKKRISFEVLSNGRVVSLLRIHWSNVFLCFDLMQNWIGEMMVSFVAWRKIWNIRKTTRFILKKKTRSRYVYWAMVESSHFYEFNDLTCFFASIFCRIEWGRRWSRLFLGEIFEMDRNLGSRVILKKKTCT
jgi:hypothetical protein